MYDSNYATFWKRQNCGANTKSMVTRAGGRKEGLGREQRIFREINILALAPGIAVPEQSCSPNPILISFTNKKAEIQSSSSNCKSLVPSKSCCHSRGAPLGDPCPPPCHGCIPHYSCYSGYLLLLLTATSALAMAPPTCKQG